MEVLANFVRYLIELQPVMVLILLLWYSFKTDDKNLKTDEKKYLFNSVIAKELTLKQCQKCTL